MRQLEQGHAGKTREELGVIWANHLLIVGIWPPLEILVDRIRLGKSSKTMSDARDVVSIFRGSLASADQNEATSDIAIWKMGMRPSDICLLLAGCTMRFETQLLDPVTDANCLRSCRCRRGPAQNPRLPRTREIGTWKTESYRDNDLHRLGSTPKVGCISTPKLDAYDNERRHGVEPHPITHRIVSPIPIGVLHSFAAGKIR
ncbi:hypothetical protein F5Y14DRAFT_12104 [Nemania sp. NC0429]|nr:hypothetical protein F5Y14DRAFT_12104 [Nemania sp. NC0429]